VPHPSPAYLFSRPINRLEFDRTYPKDPQTFGHYIRKWRMDKGLFQAELAEMLGVDEMTIVNWEVRGMVPAKRHMERLSKVFPISLKMINSRS
jgi:ribosome-binding protein aMBF1 (putative translation factor)